MKSAREVACEYVDACDDHYEVKKHCSRCDELTAVIEARDRETVEACAKAVIGESLEDPNEENEGDEAYQEAITHCVVAIRSLSPKGTT